MLEILGSTILGILEAYGRPVTLMDIKKKLPAIVVVSDECLIEMLTTMEEVKNLGPSLWVAKGAWSDDEKGKKIKKSKETGKKMAQQGILKSSGKATQKVTAVISVPTEKPIDSSLYKAEEQIVSQNAGGSGGGEDIIQEAQDQSERCQLDKRAIIENSSDAAASDTPEKGDKYTYLGAVQLLARAALTGVDGGFREWLAGIRAGQALGGLLGELGWRDDSESWHEAQGRVLLARDRMLTFLEKEEARYTSFGFYDSTVTGKYLLDNFFDQDVEAFDPHGIYREAALMLLWQEGSVFPLNEDSDPGQWRFRSRMGEVVRLLSSLRQRFPDHKYYNESKQLVADLKYHVSPRYIPHRRISLKDFLNSGVKGVRMSQMESPALLSGALGVLESVLKSCGRDKFSDFQQRSFSHIFSKSYPINGDVKDEGFVIAAGTGSGKTLAFFAPALLKIIIEKAFYSEPVLGTKLLALYPRTKLAENQVGEFIRYAYLANRDLSQRGVGRAITVGIEYGSTPYTRRSLGRTEDMVRRGWKYDEASGGHICPYAACPECKGPLLAPTDTHHPLFGRLYCRDPLCAAAGGLDFIVLTKEDWSQAPPDILVGLTESINTRLSSPSHQNIFGLGKFCVPRFIMLDEIHLQSSITGMQVGFLIRRLLQRINHHRQRSGAQDRIQIIGLSATISEPRQFFKELTGIRQRIAVESPRDPEEMTASGSEYLILLQPPQHAEAQVLSTMIQGAMCLIHNMPQPRDGHLYQTFGFVNSRDVAYRWKDQMKDAENWDLKRHQLQGRGLYFLRHPKLIRHYKRLGSYMVAPVTDECQQCRQAPDVMCPAHRAGECWWMMGRHRTLEDPIEMEIKTAWSGDFNPAHQLVVTTSALEVGFDYDRLMAVLQYQAPTSLASFVQRRGRAGRTPGSRPVMLTVLSPHRRQDNFYFYNDHLLSEPNFSRLPLNPDNLMVLRIHGLYSVFDWLAYEMASRGISGASFPNVNQVWLGQCLGLTSGQGQLGPLMGYVARALSMSGVRRRPDLHRVMAGERGALSFALPYLVRQLQMDGSGNVNEILNNYLPSALFADINLPEIEIYWQGQSRKITEKVDLGLQETMPGKVTYRWGEPLWMPLTGLEEHLPNCHALTMENHWEVDEGSVRLDKREVPLKWQKLLMGRSLQETIKVYRPRKVSLQPFLYGRAGGGGVNRWVYDPEGGNISQRGQFDKISPRLRVSPRSNTYPITTYQVQLNSLGVAWESKSTLGPLAGAIRRIIPANSRSGYMKVAKVALGAEANLLCDGQQVFRRIAIKDRQRSLAGIGYEMETDGLRFELSPDFHRQIKITAGLLGHLRHNLFLYMISRLAQEEGWGRYFEIKNLLEVIQTWAGLAGEKGLNWCEALESNAYEADLREVLKEYYYNFSPEKAQEILGLLEAENVRRGIAAAYRAVNRMHSHEVVRDILIHSLKHALKKSCQSLAGVDASSEIGAWTRLPIDFPGEMQPAIDVFEYGMYGVGSMRSIQRRLEESPKEFWREVVKNIQHCHLGNQEEFLRSLLMLPSKHLQNIGRLVREFAESTDILSRSTIKFDIEEYFRLELGFSLGDKFKSLRRVFSLSLDLDEFTGQTLENWRLYQAVEVFRVQREKLWGRPLTAHEVGELFYKSLIERLQQGAGPGLDLDPWITLLGCYQSQRESDTQELFEKIRLNAQKDYYKALFINIESQQEIGRLIALEEDERLEVLEEILDKSISGSQREYLGSENILAFSQGAFDSVEGYSLARVYYDMLGPAESRANIDHRQAISSFLVRDKIKRAIRQRILNTCPDVCPNCLAGPCELEPPGLSQLLLSRSLLRETLDHWRSAVSGEVVNVLPGDTPGVLARKVQRAFVRQMNSEVYLRYTMAQGEQVARAAALLLEEGVTPTTGERFDLQKLGEEIIYLGSGVWVYELALGIRGDRHEIS